MTPISEDELHAFADGRLDPARREHVEAWLAGHPEHRAEIEAWRAQREQLHRAYDPVLNEAIPAHLAAIAQAAPGGFDLRRVAAVAWLALGALLGYGGHAALVPPAQPVASLARQAAVAHVVYVPEVKHPVEVGADQEAHLVAWLSRRLGSPLKPPRLDEAGYRLVGGRLLPGENKAVAQFMYENAARTRLTLYVRPDATSAGPGETGFRYAREGGVDVFYWVDGPFGYALAGNTGREDMLRLATLVYRQR
ncbi:MAG TPA: anti-sigma factor [Rhodocyclaceae bacterium]|nr:anti-sigma factor [Rhodocyclaceae bacterium]